MIYNRQHEESVVLDEPDEVGGDVIKLKARSIVTMNEAIFLAHNYPSSSYATYFT